MPILHDRGQSAQDQHRQDDLFTRRIGGVRPLVELGYSFQPGATAASYLVSPRLPELLPVSFPGIKTSRDSELVDIDKKTLVERMRRYFDPNVPNDTIKEEMPGLMARTARFEPFKTRETLCRRGFLPENIRRYLYRPLDLRWVYWEPETKLLDEKRTEYFEQMVEGNLFLFTTGRTRKANIEPPLITDSLNDLNCMDSGTRGFPLYTTDQAHIFQQSSQPGLPRPNLTETANELVRSLRVDEKILFYHVFAVTHSLAYQDENVAALRLDWPRIPIPGDRKRLQSSASLGHKVADLLLPDKPVPGVTTGQLRPELRHLAIPTKIDHSPIEEPADTKVTAGWGFRGQKNAVMCGKGKLLPHSPKDSSSLDLYLNDNLFFSNIPAPVYAMTIGGYPVLKKWLSYREYKVLGRALRTEELTYFSQMVRRLQALLLLSADLDANYRSVASAPQLSLPQE